MKTLTDYIEEGRYSKIAGGASAGALRYGIIGVKTGILGGTTAHFMQRDKGLTRAERDEKLRKRIKRGVAVMGTLGAVTGGYRGARYIARKNPRIKYRRHR